ncbi:LysM peptidoglycan-binding domain-containing M23 family metallopeptidase [Deinococcus radiotolerans]|uniref:LysM domain-containing protein n=1 Tax=Deinococcus radiotolerans TaxID=1309407 RepID=A0ABQ2FPV5_9DEIO|nr:M23 family metallopeptidase [Deinococcus radiotolerans]GGL14875.1 hypothetical protein GCM10010844_37150 [Deinococcus radiotolerans]
MGVRMWMRGALLGAALAAGWTGAGLAGSYRVKAGETLSGIAARAGVSVAQLRAANPRLKNADVVQAGWVLTVPQAARATATNAPVRTGTYTVKAGENLTVIAQRFGLSLTQLVNANPQYRGGKAVWAGAKLIIPPRTASATARTPVTVRATGSRPGRWAWPLPGYHAISSDYGERVLDGDPEMHYGVDIVAPEGTPVRAARSGRVLESRADYERGWGWTVVLEHPDGWITRYAHLSATLVKAGELVVQGQPVGRVGNTGRSTGTHLHFGTYLRWDPRDPLSLY